ncbi:hypothetical protein [Laspinema palackyanum]|uniref:hypothetical protein n=1 Tax=Laspinema palackyanum TaxID=3231601 RepID=UPI00345D612E|nr:hypothetical protein [Laspinema sp. D2c]
MMEDIGGGIPCPSPNILHQSHSASAAIASKGHQSETFRFRVPPGSIGPLNPPKIPHHRNQNSRLK